MMLKDKEIYIMNGNQTKKDKGRPTMKTVAYMRVSATKQIGGGGYERQLDRIRKFCTSHKLEISDVYKEQVTGTADETKRPVFMAMVGDIVNNGAKTVIVESLDRLARELRIQEQLLIYLSAKGIDLISANTGENVTQAIKGDPIRKLMVQMQGAFAEFEKNLILDRLARGRRRKITETGRCGGSPQYGATEEEREAVKTITYMRRLGRGQVKRKSFQKIADELNARNIPTRKGNKWSAATVWQVCKRH